MTRAVVVSEHSLHRTRKAGTSWIIEVGFEPLVVIVERFKEVGSVILRAVLEPLLNGLSTDAHLILEPLDLA